MKQKNKATSLPRPAVRPDLTTRHDATAQPTLRPAAQPNAPAQPVDNHTAVSVAPSQSSVPPEPKMLGYVRVSTREQNEDRQVIAMREFGVPEDCILVEKQSGKDFNRPVYQGVISSLRPGDILVVKSIDRLGRNYEEIITQWRIITKEKRAAIVVIDMPLLDTRKEHDLTGTLVADLVLQLLSYVAETERRFIKQRQTEGIAAAKARGVKFGPPEKEKPENYSQVMEQYRLGMISQRQSALKLGISRFTFKKWLDQEDANCQGNEAEETKKSSDNV